MMQKIPKIVCEIDIVFPNKSFKILRKVTFNFTSISNDGVSVNVGTRIEFWGNFPIFEDNPVFEI